MSIISVREKAANTFIGEYLLVCSAALLVMSVGLYNREERDEAYKIKGNDLGTVIDHYIDFHPRCVTSIWWTESLFPFPGESLMAVGHSTSLELPAVNRDGKMRAIDEAQAWIHPGICGWGFLEPVHGY